MINQHRPKTIAIFGGAFNPPHLAHLFTVTYLITRADIDEVWFLPSFKHVFNKNMRPFEERAHLLRRACASMQNVHICEIESEPMFSGRTYDTLEELSKRYPETLFKLVIGSDNLSVSHKWYRFNELCNRWPLIVMSRPGHESSMINAQSSLQFDIGPALPSVSSSEIRTHLSLPIEQQEWEMPPLSWIPHLLREEISRLYSNPSQPISEESALHPHEPSIQTKRPSVFIWGRGRCGGSLALAIRGAGLRVSSVSLRELLALKEREAIDDLRSLIAKASSYDLWLIASRDDKIEPISSLLSSLLSSLRPSQLSRNNSPLPQVVAHCSGIASPRRLEPLKKWGMQTAQCHPLYSFKTSQTPPEALHGVAYFITGHATAYELLSSLVNDLKGNVLNLPSLANSALDKQEQLAEKYSDSCPDVVNEDHRLLYHAAAVIGANLSMVPLSLSELLLEEIGIPRREARAAVQHLYHSALSAYLNDLETSTNNQSTNTLINEDPHTPLQVFKEQLTGPLMRGDLNTIEAHLIALRGAVKGNPTKEVVVHAYLALSLAAARLLDRTELIKFFEGELFMDK